VRTPGADTIVDENERNEVRVLRVERVPVAKQWECAIPSPLPSVFASLRRDWYNRAGRCDFNHAKRMSRLRKQSECKWIKMHKVSYGFYTTDTRMFTHELYLSF
jgi:hypothetical protein